MPTRYYRPTVLGCALAWFLVGLHYPAVHEITSHGRAPHWSLAVVLSGLAAAAVASLWILLRAPVPPRETERSRAPVR